MLAEELKTLVLSAGLAPGAQLPTEGELCTRYSVSRTVVREAISRLRSEGIVETRQGQGVFVSETAVRSRFAVDWDHVRTLPATVELMQLRMGVEVESAGLSAQHRSDEEAAGLRALLRGIDAGLGRREAPPIIYDFEFHLAIARASRNAYILQMLKFLEPLVVSRFSLSAQIDRSFTAEYSGVARAEHEAIVRAIDARHGAEARKAMRRHLTNSIDRLTRLAGRLSAILEAVSPPEPLPDLMLRDRLVIDGLPARPDCSARDTE